MALKQKPIKIQQGNQEVDVIDFENLKQIHGLEDPELDTLGAIDFDALRESSKTEILSPTPEGIDPLPEPKKEIKTEADRSDRITEIDAEVNQLTEEIRKFSDGLYEELGFEEEIKRKERRDEINQRNFQIRELTGERERLKKELQPAPQSLKDNLVAGVENNMYLEMVDTHGEDLVHKTLSEERSKAVGAYYENRYKGVTQKKYDGTKFDFSYLIHGKRDPLVHKQTSAAGAQELWLDIRDDLEYRQGNFLSRRAHIAKKIQEQVTEKFQAVEGQEPVSKEVQDAYKAELQEYMIDQYNFTDEGGLSNNGVQSFAEYIHQTAGDYLTELRKEREKSKSIIDQAYALPEMGQDPAEKVSTNERENASYYNDYLTQEIDRVQTALKYAKKIIDAPTSTNLSTFGQGLKRSHSPIDLMSLGITEMVDAFHLVDIANKQIDGKELTHSEDMMMAMYLGLQEANSFDRKEIRIGNSNVKIKPENIGKNITAMLPYILSFTASGFAYRGVAKGVTKGLSKVAGKKLTSQVLFRYGKKKTAYTLGDLAVKNAARVTGAAAQTAILPQFYMKHTAERMIEEGPIGYDEDAKEITGELTRNNLPFKKAAKRGYWEAYSEIFTERAGLHLMRPIKGLGKAIGKGVGKGIGGKTGKETAQLTFLKYLKNLKGIKTNSQLRKLVVERNMGWHGASEEYLEELANVFMASAGTKDPIPMGEGKFASDQLETFLTVAIFGGAANISQYLVQESVGDDIRYKKADGTSFTIPYKLHQELRTIFLSEGPLDGDAMAAAMAPYKDKLSAKQQKGVMELALQSILKKNAAETVEKTETPEEKTNILEGFESEKAAAVDVTEPKDVRPTQSEADRKKVEAFNKNIEAKFPDLVQADMLPKDPNTGQYERPDVEWMSDELAVIDQEIATKAKFGDRSGRIVNRTDEIRDLEYRQQVLRNYLHAFEEYSAIPWNELVQSEKFDVLSTELRVDGPQQASLDYIAGQETLGIKLPNGRVLRGRWAEEIEKKSRPPIGKRMRAGERFTLKVDPKEKWDPKNKFPQYNREQDPDAPFPGDRIGIYDKENKFIGAVYVQNYRGEEVARADKYRGILDDIKKNLTGAGAFGTEWLADMIKARNLAVPDPDLANEFRDKIYQLINNIGDLATMSISDAINLIKKAIRDSRNLLDVHKKYLLDLMDENIESISGHLIQLKRKLGAEVPSIKIKSKLIQPGDLRVKNSEAVTLSGAAKVEESLRTFAPLWREISDDLGVGRDLVEKTFYQLAVATPLQSTNEDTFQFYIDENLSEDRVQNTILEKLRSLDFGTVVSLFNFYENVRLVPQFGIFINKGFLQRKELNPPINLEEFVNNFINSTNGYNYTNQHGRSYSGIEAVQARVKDHRLETKERTARFMDNTPEERTAIRQAQHESDLSLLSELTGIDANVWADYFSSRTNETVAFTNPEGTEQQDYKSYDKLLEKDTYRPTKGGFAPRVQSTLMGQLTFQVGYIDVLSEFQEAYNKFFTEGNEDLNVYSNLYKLSTASTDKNDIGLKGFDIKDDQFSSFIQFSHVLKIIEDEQLDFIVQNGMRNIDEKKQGTQTLDMTLDDIWLSAFSMFLENPDSYYHNIGQFGDKPAIYYIKVDKVKDTKPLSKTLEEAAHYLHTTYLRPNQQYFIEPVRGGYTGLAANYEGKTTDDKLHNLAVDFVRNYSRHSTSLNKQFHGNLDMYAKQNKEGELTYETAFIDMVKRAGSSNSPGYRLNRYVDGGIGLEYEFAILNDKIEGLGEIFDGVVFMTGEYAAKMAVSMGDMYYKPEEHAELSSAKILSSFIDPENGNRSLTKGNWINIDILAEALPDSAYADIKKLMKKGKVNVLSFTSTNKKLEKGQPAQMFDEKGRITNFNLPQESKITRSTEDLFVQQDLRHPNLPTDSKHPVQFLANMLILPHANDLIEIMYTYQQMVLNDFNKTLAQKEELIGKLDWIIKNTNRTREEELWDLLFSGMKPTEPALQALMRTKLSSEVTTRALELPVNRATTQEVPDANGILMGRRTSADGQHVLLPQAGVSFPDVGTEPKGVRYPQKMKSQEEAIQHVQAQKDIYPDLFMSDGTIMDWEIEDGVIPGEVIMLTRIPADHPHSHTIARATIRIPGGNFTMLDKDSQVASGSDFDGDYRFNTVFYKGKNGTIILDDKTKRGRANRILYNTMLDYINPEYDAYIRAGIDTKAYKKIVDRWKKKYESGKYKSNDPRAYEESRRANMVGVTMKGILTDLNTTFSLISYLKVKFRGVLNVTGIGNLTGVINDHFGMMKIHLANLQNMAFDNAKDPGLEYMGLNEITAQMFILGLIGNKDLDSSKFKTAAAHHKAITAAIDKLSNLFNTDVYREFTDRMRKSKGSSGKGKAAGIFHDMGASQPEYIGTKDPGQAGFSWSTADADNLRSFFYAANELSDIRTFFSLTKKAPMTSADLYMARQIIKKIKLSSFKPKKGQKPAKNSFSLIDTSSFYTRSGELHKLFRIINDTMAISESVIFNDAFEHTRVGKQIMAAIWARLSRSDPNKTDFSRIELRAIIRSLNNVVAIQALNPVRTSKRLEHLFVVNLKSLRKKYPGNKFLNNITTQRYFDPLPSNPANKSTGIAVKFDYTTTGFSEEELKAIQTDFDKLPWKLQYDFTQYALSRWGTTSSRKGGSYYSFLGPKFRVDFSDMVWDELDRWKDDELSPEEKLDVMEATLQNIFTKELRELALVNPEFANEVDPASAGIIDFPITYDALESVSTVADENDLLRVAEEFRFDLPEFTEYVKKLLGKETVSLSGFAKNVFTRRENIASQLFGQYKPTDNDLRKMMPSDAIGEALASEDPALQEFIFNHLSTKYPGVQFFTSRDAFYEFVRRNGGRLMDVETTAIGHAFGNAVFIDPSKAAQSTQAHEHAHIYWDALSEDHPVKEALRFFYMNNTDETFADLDELDERIIVDIGKIATQRAKIDLSGSLLDKFLKLVKDFWREVKKLLGGYTKADILTDLSIAVWNNAGSIGPLTMPGRAVMRNMIRYTGFGSQNEKAQTTAVGNRFFISTSRLKNLFKNSHYDSAENARKGLERLNLWYKKMTKGQDLPEQLKEDEIKRMVAIDNQKMEAGTLIHNIAEHVFGTEPQNLDNLEEQFNNDITFRNTIDRFQTLKKWFESDLFHVYLQDVMGYTGPVEDVTFETEFEMVNTEFGVTGKIDLIIDLGNNNIIIADFKTSDFSYLDDKGEPTPAYTATYLPFRNPIGFLSESRENEHKLQLHSYKKLIESIRDPENPDAKNNVVGMMVIPILRNVNPNTLKITQAEIPRTKKANDGKLFKVVEISPTEKRLLKAIDLMFNASKKKVDTKNDLLEQFRDNLIEQLDEDKVDKIIPDMLAAFDFFQTFLPNGLKDVVSLDIEGIRSNGWTGILSRLPDLGYTKEDLIGEAKLSTEELFWAATAEIKKEDLDKNFTEQLVFSTFVKHEIEDAPPKGWYRHTVKRGTDNKLDSELVIYDAGFEDLEEGDSFLQIYPLSMASGAQESPSHSYRVVSVNKTHEGKVATVVALGENGDQFEFKDIQPNDGIHKVHPGTKPIPAGVQIQDKFVPRYFFTEEKHMERHFDSKVTEANFGNSGDQQAAWASYDSARRRMWGFFNQYDTIPKLRKFLNNQDAVSEFFDELRTTTPDVTGALAQLIQETAMNHHFAEFMAKENQFGPKGLMPVTLELYYIINGEPEILYRDFPKFNHYLPERMISLEFIPFSMMQYTITAALRRVHVESFEHNRVGDALNDELDLNKMIETDPHTEIVKWIYPDDPSVVGTKEAEALEYIYSNHVKYNPDYRLLMETRSESASKRQKYPRKIIVSKNFMTRKEFVKDHGTTTGAMLHQNLKHSKYDSIKVPLKKKVKRGRKHHYEVDLDEKGQPTMLTLRQIKDAFIAENLDPEGMRLYFGNRYQRFLMRQKITQNMPRTLLAEYNRDARDRFKDKSLKNNLGYDIVQHRRRMIRTDLMNPELATKYLFEGEQKAIDKMIFRHYMKNTMGPLEYVISQYDNVHKDSFAGDWLRKWTDRVLFNIHPYMDSSNDMWRIAFDFMKRLNSLNKIAFSLKTQVTNFMVGQSFNIIFEPEAHRRGMARLLDGGPTKVIENISKARNILKRYGIVNITDETEFEKLEKEHFIGPLPVHQIENIGYKPMDYIEKFNQFPIFIGLMTDKEWAAYDNKGNILNKPESLADFRIHQMALRVRSIHGDYGTAAAAPMWNHMAVDAILQFRKWVPALIYRYFHSHRFGQEFIIDSGMFAGLNAIYRIHKHNRDVKKHGSESALDEAHRRVADLERTREIGPAEIRNLQHYIDLLIENHEGDPISLKKLPVNELKAVKTALLTLTIPWITTAVLTMFVRLISSMLGDDDDDIIRQKKQYWKQFQNLLRRHYGDVWYLADVSQLQETVENLVPLVSLFLGMSRFVGHGVGLMLHTPESKYASDTFKYSEGFPKALMDSFMLLPGGSMMRQLYTFAHIRKLKHTYVTIGVPFGDDVVLGDGTPFEDGHKMSMFRVMEYAGIYQEVGKDIETYYKAEGLHDLGMDIEDYAKGMAGVKSTKRLQQKYEDAERLYALINMTDNNPELKKAVEESIKNSDKWKRIFGWADNQTVKRKQKNLEKMLLQLEESKKEKEGEK